MKSLPVERRPVDDLSVLTGADYVFHVAGMTRGRTTAEYMEANAQGTRRMIAATPATVRRFVYVSSMAAVGPNPTAAPMDETTDPQPRDDYGQSKRAGECIVLEAAGRVPVTIVRPPAVYGPRDTNFLQLFQAALAWGIVPAIGGRQKQFSLVHVDDLVAGIWLAAANPAAVGQTYFIASGTHSMEEFTAALAGALGKKLRLVNVPGVVARLAGEFGQFKWALTGKSQIMSRRKIRDLLQPRWTCSWEKARRELGYREQMPLEEGLRQTAVWYAQHRWIKTPK